MISTQILTPNLGQKYKISKHRAEKFKNLLYMPAQTSLSSSFRQLKISAFSTSRNKYLTNLTATLKTITTITTTSRHELTGKQRIFSLGSATTTNKGKKRN